MSVYLGYNEVTKQYLKSLTGGAQALRQEEVVVVDFPLLDSRCLETLT